HAAEDGGRKIALFGERANGLIEPRRRLIERSAEFFQRVAGTIAGERPKIPFGDAAGKFLQALYAGGEAEGNQQRSASGEQQDDEGTKPQAAAKGAKQLLNAGKRN